MIFVILKLALWVISIKYAIIVDKQNIRYLKRFQFASIYAIIIQYSLSRI